MKISDITKKICCICLVAVLITLSCFIYAADSTFAPGEDGVYEISTREELILFANLVNGVGTYAGAGNPEACGRLTADIAYNTGVLTSTGSLNTAGSYDAWMPIGYYVSSSESATFNGSFDGGGYTISGLFINSSSLSGIGLFGYVGKDASISNLNIADSYLEGVDWVGGIAGRTLGSITNCTVSNCSIIADDAQHGAGGIAGYSRAPITDCSSSANVFVSAKSIEGTYTACAGGIVGYGTATVSNCSNSGEVTCLNFSAGGIAGRAGDITNCLNKGTVTGTSEVGGIVGRVSNSMKNCLSYGTLYYSSTGYGAGGLAGVSDIDSGNFALYCQNNYYKGVGLTGIGETINNFGTHIAYTDYETCTQAVKNAQLSSGEVANKLGSAFGQIIGTDDKPYLVSDSAYNVYLATVTSSENGSVSGVYNETYANKEFTAAANESAYFCGWYKNGKCISSNTTYELTDDDNYSTITARFTTVLGDLNGDSELNAQDIVMLKRVLGGTLTATTALADINADGAVDSQDLTAMISTVMS